MGVHLRSTIGFRLTDDNLALTVGLYLVGCKIVGRTHYIRGDGCGEISKAAVSVSNYDGRFMMIRTFPPAEVVQTFQCVSDSSVG